AFAGLHTMDLLVGEGESEEKRADAPDTEVADDAEDLIGEEAKLGIRKAARLRKPSGDTTHTVRSNVSRDVPVPQPPFYGSRVVENISLADLFSFINETALFKGQWQFKQGRMPLEEYQALVREKVRPIYQELKKRSAQEKLLVPKVVYGYYQCQSEGNDLIVYDQDKEVRFTFPRQPAGKHLCLAKSFSSREAGPTDTVAFHLVNDEYRMSVNSHVLFKADNY